MNPEVKSKWLAALRSGEYKQSQGQLRQGNTFCCLGVLCDLYDKEGWQHSSFLGCTSYPPNKVREWAEIEDEDCNPQIPEDTVYPQRKLSGFNDSGESFDKIADLIEKYL